MFAPPVITRAQSQVATLRGTVMDARTGAPLSKVLVTVEGAASTETGPDGSFTLGGLEPGHVRLYVSAVGYGLVQRTLQLEPGAAHEIRIPLSEGAAAYTEELTVKADRFRRSEPGVPAQHAIGGAELQNLRGVLADDALRAVQVLPGVATGDDFRSEFSVRGSDFSHMNFMVDGFATPFLMHMVRAVEERANTGSVAMINSDVLEEVSLSNGGYAQRSGNRTGAELAFTLREGSRDRNVLRVSVSGTSASVTAEGPIGRSNRGSWLVSGRKSYLDLLIDRLREEGLSFGFADAQAKLRYDVTDRQSASLTLVAGSSRLEEVAQQADESDLFIGSNGSAIVIATWRATFARGMLTAGGMGSANSFRNHTSNGISLEEGSSEQIAARTDLNLTVSERLHFESGVLIEQTDESQRRQRLVSASSTTLLNDYRADAARAGAYARLRIRPVPRLVLSPGARVDRWQLTRQSTLSPWVQTELTLPRDVVVRGATGVYQQFPDFEESTGAFGSPDVRPERAIHWDVSVERRVSPATRIQISLYTRKDDELIRRPDADARLVAGRIRRGSLTAPYANRLRGYARGIETLVQRSSPDGLSGWLSYAYGRSRYEDTVTHEEYWGDLDQRHTLNGYAFYRFSHRFSASGKLRMGSNFPIPGYYRREDDAYFVSDRRNELRLPAYARLDLRANRTFDWSRKRLTVFVEVLNVLNRGNVRFNPPRISTSTGQVTRLYDALVPVVPSAGILLEF